MTKKLKKLKSEKGSRLFVLKELTKKEKKRMHAETSLGQLWCVLDPLLHMLVFSFLATNWFKHELENFSMFVMTGYCIYILFNNATINSITALAANKSFLIQTKWKKEVFVEQRIYSAGMDFLYTCAAYVILMLFFHIVPSVKVLFVIPDMLLMLLLVYGMGKILAVAYVFFADIRYFYENFMTLLLFASGIFYPTEIVPDEARWILEWNPIWLCSEIARNSVMYDQFTPLWVWGRLIVWSMVLFFAGNMIFRKNENAVMQKL